MKETFVKKFWSHVRKSEACWTWTGRLAGQGGYGQIWSPNKRRHVYAHRTSWEMHFGDIPPKKLICHHCDNPKCVRPDHLFLGTYLDNAIDCKNKGRTCTGDRNGARIYPERISRGLKHSKAVRRGDSHWTRKHPEKLSRGASHWSIIHPEMLARGESNGTAKLNSNDVRKIRKLKVGGLSEWKITRIIGKVSRSSIRSVIIGKTWGHIK